MWKYGFNSSDKNINSEQFHEFNNLFRKNCINPKQFAHDVKFIFDKKDPKINALRLVGVPNSGKTLIANCLVDPFICCYMNNHGSENEFFLSNMLNKSIILCEELYITTATAEDFKSILGGQNIDVAKKHCEKQLLSRTPVIITSNYDLFGRGHLPPLDENALQLRCKNYDFISPYKPKIRLTSSQFYLFLAHYLY